MLNKKGALELSVSTIIIIVIGVTLLVLGLVFVQGTFRKVTELSEGAFRAADEQIQNNMGASDKIYIPGQTFEVDSGESSTINIGVQNFKESGSEPKSSPFKIDVSGGIGEDISEWFVLPKEAVLVAVGEKKGIQILLTILDGVIPGSAFSFSIKVLKGNSIYGQEVIIVKVKK